MAQAHYLKYVCELRTNTKAADQHMEAFIINCPFNTYQILGSFHLGHYYFSKSQFEKVIPMHEKAKAQLLSNNEISVRNFELGYAYLVTGQLEKASTLLKSVKNIPGEYFTPGNYYHGIMEYYNGNYAEAKKSFERVSDVAEYKDMVPFYLCELEVVSGMEEEALQKSLQLLKTNNGGYYQEELNQLVGHIYMSRNNYTEAIPYFSKYLNNKTQARTEDYFRLGYCYYQEGNINEAASNFNKIQLNSDSLSIIGAYYYANCLLKLGQKEEALKALEHCKQVSNHNITETSAYIIAKLYFEKKDYSQTIRDLKQFLAVFPGSNYTTEAREMLISSLLKTEQFSEVQSELNNVELLSDGLKSTYQKACYANGVRQLKVGNPENAVPFFEETKLYDADPYTTSGAHFWLAECHYRTGNYAQALKEAEEYINTDINNTNKEKRQQLFLLKAYIHKAQGETIAMNDAYTSYVDSSVSADIATLLANPKPEFIPSHIPSTEQKNQIFTYQLPEYEYNSIYKPVPLKPLMLNQVDHSPIFRNYIHTYIGNLSTLGLHTGYDLSRHTNIPLYADFRTDGQSGKLPFQRSRNTHFGLYGTTEYKNHRLQPQFTINRNAVHYYGYNTSIYDYSNTDIRQAFTHVQLASHVQPTKKNKHAISYEAQTSFGIYLDRFRASETSFYLNSPLRKTIQDDIQLQITPILDLNIYHVVSQGTQLNGMLQAGISAKKILSKELAIQVGIKPSIAQRFYFLPEATAYYKLPKYNMQLEAGFTTILDLNTFRSLSQVNPFMFNNYNVKQSRYSTLYGAIQGSWQKNWSYSGKIGLARISNLPLFMNDTQGDMKQFNVLHDAMATSLLLEAGTNYVINRQSQAGFKFQTRPILDLSTHEEAWHYVPTQFDAYIVHQLIPQLQLRSDLFVRSGSKALAKNESTGLVYKRQLKPAFDLNLSAQMKIASGWNAHAGIYNLLGSKYERWHQYPNFGTQIRVGISHSFNSVYPFQKGKGANVRH